MERLPAVRPEIVHHRSEAARHQNLARLAELGSEIRDPSAATIPLTTRWSGVGQPMIPQFDTDTAIQWAFYANVIVYRCMQILANTASSCPFRAGMTPPSQPGEVTEFNPKARLAQLLGPPPGGPAPKLTARRLWAWTVVQRMIAGKHGWEVETSGRSGKGEVVALWPLVSARLNPVASTGGTDWFSSFEYGTRADQRNLRTLNPEQVVYGWNPAANDFRQAESFLQAARLDVSIAVMGDRYSYGFLRNDARPAAVVVTEAFNSNDDFRRFKHEWYGEFGGPDNAGKVSFIETPPESDVKPSEAINVTTLGLSQRDARFIEQHQASLQRIAMACGVPWSKLDASQRTFDNADEENETFWVQTMNPLLSDLADEVNIQVAPRVGPEVGWFDLTHVPVFKPRTRFLTMRDAAFALDRQAVVINEVRDDLRLDPVPWGDKPIPPPAPVQIEQPKSEASAEPGEERDDPIVTPEEMFRSPMVHKHMHTHDDGTMHSHVHMHPMGVDDHGDFAPVAHTHGHVSKLVLRQPLPKEMETRDVWDWTRETADEAKERRSRTWRSADATVRSLETRWTRSMRRLFNRQEKATLARLAGSGRNGSPGRGRRIIEGRATADDIFDPKYWQQETADDAESLYELVAAAGFARVAGQFGISFDLEAPYAQAFVKARANQLAGQVTDTTYQAIKDQLAQGVEAGESVPDLADRVRQVFAEANDVRATMIARTEVNSAFNASTNLGAQQLPDDVVVGQEWIATLDNRTRDEHADADGQVVGLDEPFNVGGESLMYPGDPAGSPEEVINCRCTIGLLTPDQMPQRSRVPIRAAAAVLAMVDGRIDEIALRRALLEVAA